MARYLHKSWTDKEAHRKAGRYGGWVRRVRWYGEGHFGSTNIRLKFEDETGEQAVVYGDNREDADKDWAAFKTGELTVAKVLLRSAGS